MEFDEFPPISAPYSYASAGPPRKRAAKIKLCVLCGEVVEGFLKRMHTACIARKKKSRQHTYYVTHSKRWSTIYAEKKRAKQKQKAT